MATFQNTSIIFGFQKLNKYSQTRTATVSPPTVKSQGCRVKFSQLFLRYNITCYCAMLILQIESIENQKKITPGPILGTGGEGAFLGLTTPKQKSFLPIFNKNIFFKTPNKGLE